MNKTIYVAEDLGCVYRWDDEFKVLIWAPLHRDGTFDFEGEGGAVDEYAVGNERVCFEGEKRNLSEVYRLVETRLTPFQ